MRLIFLLLSLLTVFSMPSIADEARPVYVEIIEQQSAEYLLKWKIPPVMPDRQEPAIELSHSSCSIIGNGVSGRPAGLVGRKLYRCEQASPAFSVQLIYPRSNPALTSLVVFKPLVGDPVQVFSGPEKTTIEMPLASSPSDVAKQYTVAGIEHILIGTDHLLFVVCLIMIAGSFKRLLLTVTGFTVAHSITLSLATLNIFRLPTELVELLIALSILLLAVEIIKHRRGIEQDSFTWRYPISVSAVFGLLHGFGFAVVLQELGLPASMKVHALLFFNIGVELGQLAFIVAVLALTATVTRIAIIGRHREKLAEAAIYTIGICSAYWLFERSVFLI
ncbi:MAG: HupE/UreJ family protein [Porticoccaceae bacterium]|nr:HupE/UreJ family protein [Porticoccaceae bacterium]